MAKNLRNQMTPTQLSPVQYLKLAALLVLAGIIMLVAFVALAPRLAISNLADEFYYLVLVAWGLISAVILFGALVGYSRLSYHQVGLKIELGGPSVVALLVVVGGFELVPHGGTFDQIVEVHGSNDSAIDSGSLRMEFRTEPAQTVKINGSEAEFRIAVSNKGTTAKIFPDVDGYDRTSQQVKLSGKNIEFQLIPENSFTDFKGQLTPVPVDFENVTISFEYGDNSGGWGYAHVDDKNGNVHFRVYKKLKEEIKVEVCDQGRIVSSRFHTLQSGIEPILIHAPGDPCSNRH